MKQRLDLILVDRGLAPTRTIAQAMIMAGEVRSGTVALTKPGQTYDTDIDLTIAQKSRYVSRGGDKIASVSEDLKLDFNNKIVLDVGSSTGGFTDFALQHGAAKVYAVDVGTSQLAYALREDPRVIAMEQTDIRSVVELPEPIDIAMIDVSFISLTKIISSVAALVKPGGLIVAMAKPQFETDKATADLYKGVIKDESIRKAIIDKFESFIKSDFKIIASKDSEVTGAQGNRERFYVLSKIA